MDIFGLIPTLGKAIAGDIGGAVQEGLKALGIEPTGNDDEDKKIWEKAASRPTPEQIVRLKEADLQYKKDLSDKKLKIEELVVDTVKGSQAMYVATKDKTVPTLAFISAFGFIGMIIALFTVPVPEDNKGMIHTLVGNVFGLVAAVYTFYFGSSKGSQDKDDKIARMKY
jgi:hypothetical protein